MSAVALTLAAELETAVQRSSPERRAWMLRKVAELFLATVDRLDEPQVDVFGDVLISLMEPVDASALIQLSRTLSEVDLAPRELIRRLASHDNASVAEPVLLRSRRLSDQDLIAIAGTRSERHLLAMSDRQTLGEGVTEALLARGYAGVACVLASNAGARFSVVGYRILVESAARHAGLAARLGTRSDLPPNVRSQLLLNGTEAVRSRLSQVAPPGATDTVKVADIVKTMGVRIAGAKTSIKTTSITTASPAKPATVEARDTEARGTVDYAEAETTALSLSRAGRLNDSTISRFGLDRDRRHVVAAVALLSTASSAVIAQLLAGESPQGFMVACRAARLDWSTAATILRGCGHHAITQQELDEGRAMFDALPLSAAQHAVRSWSAGAAARGPRMTAD